MDSCTNFFNYTFKNKVYSPGRHFSAPRSLSAGAPAAEMDPETQAVPPGSPTHKNKPLQPQACGCRYHSHGIACCFWKSGSSGLIAAEWVVRKCKTALYAAFCWGRWKLSFTLEWWDKAVGCCCKTSAPLLSCCEQHLSGLEKFKNPIPPLFLLNCRIRQCIR